MAIAFRGCQITRNETTGHNITARMPGYFNASHIYSVGSNNGGGGTTITCFLPSLRLVDQILVMALTVRGGTGTTITLPQNSAAETWTLLNRTNSTTVLAQATYWKLATATDVTDTSVVVTITSNKASAIVCCITEGETSAPASTQYNGQANASSLTVSYAALGTWSSTEGISLLFGGMARGANTSGTATNYTNRANAESTGGGASSRTQTHSSSRSDMGAVTTIGTQTETWTGTADVNIGSQVFIKSKASAALVVDGDILLMAISVGSITLRETVTTPAGWTLLTSCSNIAGNLMNQYLFWRVASSEPASYAVTTATGTSASPVAVIVAFSGASSSTPAAAQYGSAGHTASTTHTADALGSWSSTDGVDVVLYSESGSSMEWPDPTNYTGPAYNFARSGGGGSTTHELFYRILSGVTTVGAVSTPSTFSVAYSSAHCFIAVPAAAGGGEGMPYIGGGYYP